MIITFCGHADYRASAEDEKKILSVLSERVGDRKAELFLGGYGSFDAFAQRCGRKYQETHPNTKLIFVTPYVSPSKEKLYSYDQKPSYDSILYPPLERVPMRFAISRRNEWMIDEADLVIAYIRHDWGGAYKTYEHALKKQKEIFNLADKSL